MIENVSTQLTVFHCFAHCLLPGRAFASLYALLFLEKEAEIGGRELVQFVHNIISNLDGAMNRGHKQTDLIIMDFAKAFDKVPHRRLLHKFDYYGIRGSTHKWISSWLSGRSQQVVLDGQASDPVPVLFGVPQGSVLGPILLLIFINDLPDNIKSSVCLFADDCVLYRNIHSLQDCLILQEDLDSLGLWEADWQRKFSVAKCHFMRVTWHYSHKQIIHDYTLHQQTLENVQSAKYLGITITENMDWGQHISDISSKATKTLGFLRRNLAFAPSSTKEVAYKTLVRPKLEFAAPIWSPYQSSRKRRIRRIFTPTFGFVLVHFPAGDSNLRKFFFC